MEPVRVLRIFKVMDYLTDHPEGRSLSEIARHFDFPVSSAHDLIGTMVEAKVLTTSEKRYALGPLALALGTRLSEAIDVRRIARPHLAALVERIEDDIYLAVSAGAVVMHVDQYPGTRAVRISVKLGQRLYLHTTATGKLFAAYDPRLRAIALKGRRPRLTAQTLTKAADLERDLDTIVEQGYSVSREESFEGVMGVAVPIFDSGGDLAAAIHVPLLVGATLDDRLETVIKQLQATAQTIGSEVGPVGQYLEQSG